MTEAAKDAYKAVVNSNFVDELINKMVGIDKEDRTFIKENKDLVNDYIS
jgi:rRNA-processing protein FCF1